MHSARLFILLALVLPAAGHAARKPAEPPLPPLDLPLQAPIVTLMLNGQPLRLIVDPGTSNAVQLNASAANRLGLADPGFLVAGRKPDRGRITTNVGKVKLREASVAVLADYAGRTVPLTLGWSDSDFVAGADGSITPSKLPHDIIRFSQRPPRAGDRTEVLPMRWESGRGLLGTLPVGSHEVDIVIDTSVAESVATAAAAAWLAETYDGRLSGPRRDIIITRAIRRPVRDVRFARPFDAAGLRFDRIAARVFDWSGRTAIPEDDDNSGALPVTGRVSNQSSWAKLVIARDKLAACAGLEWQRQPLQISLTCPALP